MGYRVLKKANWFYSGRCALENFGVTKAGITLNRTMIARLGLREGDRLLLLVSEDGYLVLATAREDDPNGRRLIRSRGRNKKPFGEGSLICHCRDVVRMTRPGRYRITRQDGAFFVTDCPYDEPKEE